MFKWLRRREEPVESVLPRVQAAIDELNAALKELKKEEEYRFYRPWVRSGDLRTRSRPKVMLGYWDQEGQCFITTYGED